MENNDNIFFRGRQANLITGYLITDICEKHFLFKICLPLILSSRYLTRHHTHTQTCTITIPVFTFKLLNDSLYYDIFAVE